MFVFCFSPAHYSRPKRRVIIVEKKYNRHVSYHGDPRYDDNFHNGLYGDEDENEAGTEDSSHERMISLTSTPSGISVHDNDSWSTNDSLVLSPDCKALRRASRLIMYVYDQLANNIPYNPHCIPAHNIYPLL